MDGSASSENTPGAGVNAETAAKALASVTPLGKEMARALMWLVDECISGVALELQQEARAGTLSLDGDVCHIVRDTIVPEPGLTAAQREGVALRSPIYCDTRQDLNDKPGYDCFGQPLMSAAGDKSTENVMCPNCGQKTGAARFAPHLQRCMGGGRNATTTRRSTTPNGSSGRNSTEPREVGSGSGMRRVSSGSKLGGSPTPPVTSAFSAGGAGAIVSEKIQKSAERGAVNSSSKDKDKDKVVRQPGTTGTKVASAKHQPALAIANAAVRGGSRPAAGSPSSRAHGKAARTSE